MSVTILKGMIVSCARPETPEITENGYLVAEDRQIAGVYPVLPEQYRGAPIEDYGQALMNAVRAQYEFDYTKAESYWREALRYNQNLFLAYSGIGRAMLRNGDANGALEFLKLGDDRKYYSKALEKVRNETLKQYLVPVALGLIGLTAAVKLLKAGVKRAKERRRTA